MNLRGKCLIGAVVQQEFDNVDAVLLSSDIHRRETILQTHTRTTSRIRHVTLPYTGLHIRRLSRTLTQLAVNRPI